MMSEMKRLFLLLFALLVCLPAWSQTDSSANGVERDKNGFLPLAASPATVAAPVVTNPPATATFPAPSAAVPAEVIAAVPVATPVAVTTAPLATVPKAIQPVVSDTNFVISSLAGLDSSYNLDDKHKLAPGDRISFKIVEDRTNAMPMLVTESSELDVPYIGRISVASKTCKQLAGELKALLEKDYYYKATVIIGLDELGKVAGKVYIVGPVIHPGPVEIPANENFTAAKAILQAGGFGDFANKNEVQIFRKTPDGNKKFTVNMTEVMKGNTEQDVVLQDGDFIVVKARALNL